MAQFAYTGRAKTGEKVQGTVEAADRRSAVAQIERLGHIPVTVSEPSVAAGKPVAKKKAGTASFWRGSRPRMGMHETLMFTTELSDLLASGMRLSSALNCLANRQTGRGSDAIIAQVRDAILQGASLSEAMAQTPGSFSNLYVSMIQAGEASGALAEVLRRLVDHYEGIQELREKVVMALVYPMIVLFLGLATMVFSMVYVVPKFKVIFDQLGGTLPLPTQMLISTSTWLARYGWIALGVIVFLSVVANRFVNTKAGQLWWHGVLLRMPLVRGIVASGIYVNFAATLQTLMDNGVPVLKALGIVEKTVNNAVISREIRNARERVTDGTTISGPMAAGKVFPSMMTDMLSIGEQTGDMSSALKHIARRYQNELNRNIKVFTTALEPILIVVVAVMVGFVAISILMAVFNMTNGLNV
jgi:type II secretory pathway component PulF